MDDNLLVCRWLEWYFKWDSGVKGCQILDRNTEDFDTRLILRKSRFFRPLDEICFYQTHTFRQYYFSKHPVSASRTRLRFSENHSRLYHLFGTQQHYFGRGEPKFGNFSLSKFSSSIIEVSAGCDL